MRINKQENKNLKECIIKQDKRLEYLEREVRKKNIIIKGIVEEKEEEERETKEKIKRILNKLDVEIDLEKETDGIRRIGKYKKEGKRPIIVKQQQKKKTKIMKQASKLKGTNIWIDGDFTRKVQEQRRLLIPHLKEARNKGYKADLKYNYLKINGERYEIGDLEIEEKENEKKRKVGERSNFGDSLNEQLKKITKTSTPKK